MVSEMVSNVLKWIKETVLILVLVEDGLGEVFSKFLFKFNIVLILVLVEDGLGGILDGLFNPIVIGLNPCSSGRWSRRRKTKKFYVNKNES